MVALYNSYKVMHARYRYIQLGQPESLGEWNERIQAVLRQVFGHTKVLKDRKSGWMHVVIFYGFIIFQFGILEIIVKGFVKGFQWPIGLLHPLFSLSQEITIAAIYVAAAKGGYEVVISRAGTIRVQCVIIVCALMR